MNELERFAAALLVQWRADGGADTAPIAVGTLLDRVLPYRVARRLLGIDVSEDYEALVLRLISEEDRLVLTEPLDAAEMAKATMASKLPDLDVLQLLRSATVKLTPQSIARLDGVLPMPRPRPESGSSDRFSAESHEPAAASSPDAVIEAVVIPLPTPAIAPPPAVPVGPPAEFLTTVSFTPPAVAHCWSCTESLPADREVKFCPFCGADQRQPACTGCGGALERGWKHCPECGTRVGAGPPH